MQMTRVSLFYLQPRRSRTRPVVPKYYYYYYYYYCSYYYYYY